MQLEPLERSAILTLSIDMSTLLSFLQQRLQAWLDPRHDERVASHVTALYRAIAAHPAGFDLARAQQQLGIARGDRLPVAEGVYRKVLRDDWIDGQLSMSEQKSLRWLAERLRLPADDVKRVQVEVGHQVFEQCLAKTMGEKFDERSRARLEQIATVMGTRVCDLVRGYFHEQGERLLECVFDSIAADDRVESEEWRQLQKITDWLGVGRADMHAAIDGHANRLIEKLLANARCDGVLSVDAEQTLLRLLRRAPLSHECRAYVKEEMQLLRSLEKIKGGTLPMLPQNAAVALKHGERAHYQGHAKYTQHFLFSNGTSTTNSTGMATITNSRLIFTSFNKTTQLTHEGLVALRLSPAGVEVRTLRVTGTYDFGGQNRLAFAIYRAAAPHVIGGYGNGCEKMSFARVSPETRTHVWDRDRGQCVRCGSNRLLEFVELAPHDARDEALNSFAEYVLLCNQCHLQINCSASSKPEREPVAV